MTAKFPMINIKIANGEHQIGKYPGAYRENLIPSPIYSIAKGRQIIRDVKNIVVV